jgi:tetratricopeptide (TPR) repeat protein
VEAQPARLISQAFGAAGGISYWQGDTAATHRYYGRALEAANRTEDKALIARSMYNFGFAPIDAEAPSMDVYAAGVTYMQEALALFEEIGDKQGTADARWALSIGYLAGGAGFEQATQSAREAHRLYSELNDPFGRAWAAYMIGSHLVTQNKIDDIDPPLQEALDLFVASRDDSGILLVLALYAVAADRRGQREKFLRLGGALERMREETGAGIADTPVEFLDFTLPEMPASDEERGIWAEGRLLSTDEAVALARESDG